MLGYSTTKQTRIVSVHRDAAAEIKELCVRRDTEIEIPGIVSEIRVVSEMLPQMCWTCVIVEILEILERSLC